MTPQKQEVHLNITTRENETRQLKHKVCVCVCLCVKGTDQNYQPQVEKLSSFKSGNEELLNMKQLV